MAPKNAQRPGEKAKSSGQYQPVGPRGGPRGPEITVVKGKTLPPSPELGLLYVNVDPTKNKSGQE